MGLLRNQVKEEIDWALATKRELVGHKLSMMDSGGRRHGPHSGEISIKRAAVGRNGDGKPMMKRIDLVVKV